MVGQWRDRGREHAAGSIHIYTVAQLQQRLYHRHQRRRRRSGGDHRYKEHDRYRGQRRADGWLTNTLRHHRRRQRHSFRQRDVSHGCGQCQWQLTLTVSGIAGGQFELLHIGVVDITVLLWRRLWAAAVRSLREHAAGRLTFTPSLNYNSEFTIATSLTTVQRRRDHHLHRGQRRADGEQSQCSGDLYRRHPAQSHRHRGERCR